MPTWSEYKETARGRGALALELFVVQSTPAKDPATLQATLPDHLAYQQTLETSGQLAFAGPVSDATGTLMQGAGMIIYRAASLEAARKLAEADPMHKTGARTFTICAWLINEGSLSLNIGLSTKAVVMG
jgi:uncharacterized protein